MLRQVSNGDINSKPTGNILHSSFTQSTSIKDCIPSTLAKYAHWRMLRLATDNRLALGCADKETCAA